MENLPSSRHVKISESRNAIPLDNLQLAHKSFQRPADLAPSPPPFSFKFVPRTTSNRMAGTSSSSKFANQSSFPPPPSFKRTPDPSSEHTVIDGSIFQQPFYVTNARHPLFNISRRPNESLNVSPQLNNTTSDTSPPQLSLFDDFDAIHHMTTFSSKLGNDESIQDSDKLQHPQVITPDVESDLAAKKLSSDTKEYCFIDDNHKRQQLLPSIMTSALDEETGTGSNVNVEDCSDQKQIPVDMIANAMKVTHIIQSCTETMQQCGEGVQKLLRLKEIHGQQNQSVELVEINGILESRSQLVESKLQWSKEAVKQLAEQGTLYQSRKQLNLDFRKAIELDIKWMMDYANEMKLNNELLQKCQRNMDFGQPDNKSRSSVYLKNESSRCEEDVATIELTTNMTDHHFVAQCKDMKNQLVSISTSFEDLWAVFAEQMKRSKNSRGEHASVRDKVSLAMKTRLDQTLLDLSDRTSINMKQQQEISQLKEDLDRQADVMEIILDSRVHDLIRQASVMATESERLARELEKQKEKIRCFEKQNKLLEAKLQASAKQPSANRQQISKVNKNKDCFMIRIKKAKVAKAPSTRKKSGSKKKSKKRTSSTKSKSTTQIEIPRRITRRTAAYLASQAKAQDELKNQPN
ncbi:hypothetical protein BCR42DRAFT_441973 [Absidia repens]|uniref:Uncharacterized protein n=1 Tax=Absidia repens TaxID=90262 RepID=A0A1X2I5U4_9FUNG|nr:hypothetical protein BCR42DRAFT_441973 [Absidia repens]